MAVRSVLVGLVAVGTATLPGCKNDETTNAAAKPLTRSAPVVQPAVGFQQRMGDEIVVCGQFYRIGTRVVTWMDPGGFDAYRTEKRFDPWETADYEAQVQPELTKAAATTQKAARDRAANPANFPATGPATRNVIPNPARFSLRYQDSAAFWRMAATRPAMNDAANFDSPTTRPLTKEELAQVRGGGWTLPMLQKKVDQFVVHYDVAGTSEFCFDVLHDGRGLSVQFMLDLDGTIYQTLDLKERAFHATKSNHRSIGIEIANMGSYGTTESIANLQRWYKKDPQGKTYIEIPQSRGGLASQFTKPTDKYALRPIRDEMVMGTINKLQKNGTYRASKQRQYDLTPQQYEALPKLIAALCDIFPEMKADYPREPDGTLAMRTLTNKEFNTFGGILGHYHVQTEKSDPGPAFQWDLVMDEAKRLLAERQRTAAK